MIRIALTYGLISGLVIISGILATIVLKGHHAQGAAWLGYLIMLVAMSSILVGVRQYRDQSLGGVIGFRAALATGLGIALAASLAYVLVWEVYLAVTHYSFIDQYAAQTLQAKRAAGVNGVAAAQAVAQMEAVRQQYANPLYRILITFSEIMPVGLIFALVSAVLLRNPRFLPARAAA